MRQNATKCDTPHAEPRPLTVEQHNAIDLLLSGATDAAAAAGAGVHRSTIVRWRLHDPFFQAALNTRREQLWHASLDRIRAVLPSALDTLTDQLAVAPSAPSASTRMGAFS